VHPPRLGWSDPRRGTKNPDLAAVWQLSPTWSSPAHLGSRFITGWLYNGAGSSVLIAGLFHSMHNAIVNPTGLVAVVALPQFEVLVIMAGIVVLAAAIIAVATRGRLGLK
jgi:hypothetical protein